MTDTLETTVREICAELGSDSGRAMDAAIGVQARLGSVSPRAITLIARELNAPRVEIEGLVSFYSFLSTEPAGRIVIRLCNDIIDRFHGVARVAEAFSRELGIPFGGTTPDGRISLAWTPCIGMSDQAPAALVNDVVVTSLSGDRAREIVRALADHMTPARLVRTLGDGNNAHPLVGAMVNNNLRRPGPIIFSPINRGEAIRKAVSMTPVEVIRAIKTARLRGRGGAGFPCGMKWDFAQTAEGKRKFAICNADEGEPGTFKDRVILTERPDRVFAGLTIAGYAIGASEGIVYLRGEYAYLRRFLEETLARRRADGLLGASILGRAGFDFDIRIQMGAGAYVCGEETSLISSCEGRRGDPKTRPPFPAQKGFLDCPTVVNNVETLCCVAKILEEGPATFSENGNGTSSGTKLLSISGDCMSPGVYEVPFGTTLNEVLEMAGATNAAAVQWSGPSGQMLGPDQFERRVCFDDLATGGSAMVFGPGRDLLEVAHAFMDFFVEESCGYCTPCRVGNVLLRDGMQRILDGLGDPADLEQFEQIGRTMATASRCGLGQTSSRPVITSLQQFRPLYEARVKTDADGYRRSFDLTKAVATAEAITGRPAHHARA